MINPLSLFSRSFSQERVTYHNQHLSLERSPISNKKALAKQSSFSCAVVRKPTGIPGLFSLVASYLWKSGPAPTQIEIENEKIPVDTADLLMRLAPLMSKESVTATKIKTLVSLLSVTYPDEEQPVLSGTKLELWIAKKQQAVRWLKDNTQPTTTPSVSIQPIQRFIDEYAEIPSHDKHTSHDLHQWIDTVISYCRKLTPLLTLSTEDIYSNVEMERE